MSVMILRIPFPPLMPPCDWGLWSRFRRAWAIARSLCVRKPAENGNDGRKKRIMKDIIIVGIASIYSLVNGVILHENWCKARTRNKNCHLFFFWTELVKASERRIWHTPSENVRVSTDKSKCQEASDGSWKGSSHAKTTTRLRRWKKKNEDWGLSIPDPKRNLVSEGTTGR